MTKTLASENRTVAYAMSDLAPSDDHPAGRVVVPASRGGCGLEHVVGLDGDGRPMIVCAECAPVLIGEHYGWANSPAGVPLTPDEHGEVEVSEREGQVAMRMAFKAMGDTVGKMIQGQGEVPAKPATAAELVSALSASERAEMVRMLLADQGEKPSEVPPRRGPGRPRKAS